MISPDRGTIHNIQCLRGVSALLVVFFHLGPAYEAFGIPQFGGGGVDVFFVISGFIMAYTSAQRPISGAAFMGARIRRIVPLYWAVTSFVFCLAIFAPGLMKRSHTSWLEFIQSLFFLPFERDGVLVDPVLFLGWTLNYEMFFYLMFALGLTFPRGAGQRYTAFAILGLTGLGGILDFNSPLFKFYTNPIMLEFCFGMLAALVYEQIPSQVSRPVRNLCLASAFAGLLLVIIIPVFLRDVNRAWLSGLPALMLVGSCIALEKWSLRIGSRFLLLMGAASYSLYLTHIFVTELMVKAARLLAPDAMAAAVIVASGVVLSCLLALAVYRYVEAPSQKLWRARGGAAVVGSARPGLERQG